MSEHVGETPEKKRKLNESGDNKDCHPPILSDFKDFNVQKILSRNVMQKRVTVHAKLAEEDAVVMLEKTPFDLDHMERYFTQETALTNTLKNDVYGTYQAYPPQVENGNYCRIVCRPAINFGPVFGLIFSPLIHKRRYLYHHFFGFNGDRTGMYVYT